MANGATTIEEERMMNLQRARNLENSEKLVTEMARKVAAKLNQLIAEGHDTTAFGIAIILAIIKDGLMDWALDFIIVGEIPILGQLPGIFLSAVLFYFMYGKGMFRGKIFARITLFFIADNLPFFINNAPITTLGVLYAWRNVRRKAREAEEHMKELSKKTQEELEAIEQEE